MERQAKSRGLVGSRFVQPLVVFPTPRIRYGTCVASPESVSRTRTPATPDRRPFAIAIHTVPLLPYSTIDSTLSPSHSSSILSRSNLYDRRHGYRWYRNPMSQWTLKWKAINGRRPYEASDTVLEPNPTEAQGHHSSDLFVFGSMSTTYSSTVILWI